MCLQVVEPVEVIRRYAHSSFYIHSGYSNATSSVMYYLHNKIETISLHTSLFLVGRLTILLRLVDLIVNQKVFQVEYSSV